MGIITTYFRSSSYNAWDFCQQKYFLDYTLGFRSPAGKKAEKGSIVHKALELLARRKLAQQEKKESFNDEELGSFTNVEMTPEFAIELSWNHYLAKDTGFDWKPVDRRDCIKWMNEALTWKNGMFSPLKRKVIMPEQFFDIKIEKPWAEYSYTLPDGNTLSGYLSLKGTMDLLVEAKGGALELIDWKTGTTRLDWATMKEKTYEKLMMDPQLRLYHYALSKLYPKAKNIFVTIFFLQAGGPESLCFTPDDLEVTEGMIKRRFNAIRNTVNPKLIYPSRKCSWCWFNKNGFDGPTDKRKESICHIVKQEIVQLGIDKVMKNRAKPGAFTSYGDGGGTTRAN